MTAPPLSSPQLTSYVPRLTIEWLRAAPDELGREVAGTMAFVDISGFTAMSERLAGKGKAGAEEVNEVMNATFGHLLHVAYTYGGSLLKFGGDALLLFFAGAGHERRAARAAYVMRRMLRSIGRPQTSAGAVTLRMHVGLNSGRFHFFLVGDAHRELIVSGPETGRTVELEDASEAGDILLSRATAKALAARELGDKKGGGVLLRLEPAADPQGEPLPSAEGLDLGVCVPVAVRGYVGAGQIEPEHRQAAVAFLRFSGLAPLLADDGLEAAASAVHELVSTVQAAALEHEVTFLESDVDRDGGRIVLVAGAPHSAGQDEDRLLRTVHAIVDAKTTLPVAVGVNRGRVFAGEVGAPFRRTYTILGDTAALAARLMARAQPGQILVAAPVLERARTRFETRQLEPFTVKGKSRPVVAHELLGVGRGAVSAVRHLPMVDRQRELAILGASLAPARAGFGSLVELVGDTGIGKTRLVAEVREQCADMTLLAAACEPYDASTAYSAFRDLLRSLLEVGGDGDTARNTALLRERVRAIAPDLEPWLPLLALPLDLAVESTRETDELDPAFRRARLHGVVGTLLAALLPAPTLLVFEDAHWMDGASSELLRHLGSEVTSRPWFALVTRHPTATGFSAAEGQPPLAALTMRLEPLPAEDARALVTAAATSPLPAHDIDAIVERAGGNALFLQELVAAAGRTADDEELPESVEAVVTARIDALSPGDRTVLRWASVLGMRFGVHLLAAVLEDEEAAAGAEAWDRLGEFIERDPNVAGGFRFRQAVFRDVAYEGLSYRRRRELHRRVAEIYEQHARADDPELAEMLSLHWSRAGDAERTWRYSLTAGERARAKHANVEAAGFYRRALEAARRLPELEAGEVAAVWEALGDVSDLAGRYVDAVEAYRNGRRLAEAALGPQPGLLLKEGMIREKQGQYSEALRWYTRGLAAAESLADPAECGAHRTKLMLEYAGVRLRQGLFGDCIERCRTALQDAHACSDLASTAHAYYLMHLAYTELGSPEREAFRGLALPIYEELGDLLGQANVLNNLGIDAYYEGRWDEALDLYRRSREARERIGDVVGAATITNNIGEIESDQGHLEEAEAAFREAYDVCLAAGYPLICHVATSNLGRLAARAGRVDEAAEALSTALAGFEAIRASGFVLETEARLAERDLFAGEHESAFAKATEALARTLGAEAVAHLRTQLERVRGSALLAGGDLAGARECLEESLRIARSVGVDYEAALTLAALAALARAEGSEGAAEAHEAGSRAILDRLGVVRVPTIAG